MNIISWLSRAAVVRPDSPAIFYGENLYASYGQLAAATSRRAAALKALRGIESGSRIAVLSANSPRYLEALYAIWWAGCVAVPVNAKLHAREVEYILGNAGVAACIASADWCDALSHVRLPAGCTLLDLDGDAWKRLDQADPVSFFESEDEALAWLFYTSGTTGRPKGAMLTHRNLAAMTFNYFTDVDAMAEDDCLLHAAPMSHGSGLYNFAALLRGAAQVVPRSGGFDAAEVLDLCAQFQGVAMFAAPTIVKRLTDHAAESGAMASGLKTLIYGGGPMYVADLKRAMAIFGSKFVQIYGQGESPMTITALSRSCHAAVDHPRYEQRLASVGVAHSGVEVRIFDQEGEALPPGRIGEVCVKGDTVMQGYWQDAEATARALRNGWLCTGDLGVMDEDGFLTLKDRSKDLIISGGSNIYPREIEEVLLMHPDVREVAVVGRAHPEWGEEVIAFVVAAKPVAPDVLDALCLAHIARFKRPKEYRFVGELPKNHYGKILKTALRALL